MDQRSGRVRLPIDGRTLVFIKFGGKLRVLFWNQSLNDSSLVFVTKFGVRLQPANSGDQKESQRIGSATPHEFPA